MEKGYLLIDGSYFVFYRFYALMRWWKCKTNGETLEFPIKNEEFVNKFRTTFVATIKSLYEPIFDYDWNVCKNIKIIVGKDCHRKSIWRMNLFDKYKGNRLTEDDFAGEICVSAETAWRESRSRGIHFSRELCLYLAHGWLHLAGYDDLAEDDRLAMREAEQEVLAAAEEAGPLPEFTFS